MRPLLQQLALRLEGLFDKVLTIPGVDAVVKPAIDGLRVKLNALSKA